MKKQYEVPGASKPPSLNNVRFADAKDAFNQLIRAHIVMGNARSQMINFQVDIARRVAVNCEALEVQLITAKDPATMAALAEQLNSMYENIVRILFDMERSKDQSDGRAN